MTTKAITKTTASIINNTPTDIDNTPTVASSIELFEYVHFFDSTYPISWLLVRFHLADSAIGPNLVQCLSVMTWTSDKDLEKSRKLTVASVIVMNFGIW